MFTHKCMAQITTVSPPTCTMSTLIIPKNAVSVMDMVGVTFCYIPRYPVNEIGSAAATIFLLVKFVFVPPHTEDMFHLCVKSRCYGY